MEYFNYFQTPIWVESKTEFVKSLNKASNKYVNEARKRNKITLINMETLEYHIIQLLYYMIIIF